MARSKEGCNDLMGLFRDFFNATRFLSLSKESGHGIAIYAVKDLGTLLY